MTEEQNPSSTALSHSDGGAGLILPQVVVYGVPQFARPGELENLLKNHDIQYRKLKKVPKKDFAFITFDSDIDMQSCVSRLNGELCRGTKLEVSVRSHVAEGSRKRPRETSPGDNPPKKLKEGKDAVSPWWNVPYEEQTRRKQENMKKDCLGKIGSEIAKAYKIQGTQKKAMPSWIFADSLGLRFNNIICSPETVGYRNKCEFTFGRDSAGAPSVGFRVSSFHDGTLVASPEDCPTTPNAMKVVISTLVEFIRSSPLPCYDNATHGGVWRTVMCRYSKRTGQLTLMLCVQLLGDCFDGKAATEDREINSIYNEEMRRLAVMLQTLRRQGTEVTDDESKMYEMCSCPEPSRDPMIRNSDSGSAERPLVTGLCYQVFNGLSVPPADLAYTTVFGDAMLHEVLLNCNFQVSPQAFFQVNTRTAELLFSHVIDMISADLSPVDAAATSDSDTRPDEGNAETVCLDVCCGTGTIGICVAAASAPCSTAIPGGAEVTDTRHLVLGVDLCAPAIDDAWKNAELNDIHPVIPRVLKGHCNATESNPIALSESVSSSQRRAYFVAARAEALMEGILYSQGWKGCNGNTSNPLPLEEQEKLRTELSKLRTIVSGKRLLAIVDPPREV